MPSPTTKPTGIILASILIVGVVVWLAFAVMSVAGAALIYTTVRGG